MENSFHASSEIASKDALLQEMDSFLAGRESQFPSILSSASTQTINELNEHLIEKVGSSGHLLDAVSLFPAHGGQDGSYQDVHVDALDDLSSEAGFHLLHGTGLSANLSWSSIPAMKVQVDQQLNSVLTEFQSLLGPLPADSLSDAVAMLNGLPTQALVDGTKSFTSGVMNQFTTLLGPDSLLANDMVSAIAQVMDPQSLITSDVHLAGLIDSWHLDSLPEGNSFDLVSQASGDNFEAIHPLTTPDVNILGDLASSGRDDLVLLGQLQSALPVTPVDVLNHFDGAQGKESGLDSVDLLANEGLFRPLSSQADLDAGDVAGRLNFDKLA